MTIRYKSEIRPYRLGYIAVVTGCALAAFGPWVLLLVVTLGLDIIDA